MNPLKLARDRLISSRSIYIQKVVKEQEEKDISREFTGFYAGYDSKRNEALIRQTNGSIIRAKTTSNGFIQPGSKVSGTMPLGATSAIVDWMPTN